MITPLSRVYTKTYTKANLFFRVSRHAAHASPRKDILKERMSELVMEARQKFSDIRKNYGQKIIGKITVSQVMGGMRDINCVYHNSSLLDANEGIKFHGYSIDDIFNGVLPRQSKQDQPYPEAIFWLLLTGEVPTVEQVEWLSKEWASRAELPYYVLNVIDMFPNNLHPMAQLSAAVTVLSRFSKFSNAYNASKTVKTELWKYMYEDCMNLIAKIPVIAAKIYRNCYHDGHVCAIDPTKDWAYNYAKLLGVNSSQDFVNFMRLYLIAHSDHEGGNASAHTAHLVGSTLSDVFLSFASAMNALAGPLHGRANQEVVEWIDRMVEALGPNIHSSQAIKTYCEECLKTGVIPGFGHAVLRKTDPRFTVLKDFVTSIHPKHPSLEVIHKLLEIAPSLLQATGKVKNPWPNVDLISGTILTLYDLTEVEYYTVPFGVSRVLGVSSALIWDRALNLPLERPKSLDNASLIHLAKNSVENQQ